MRLMIFGGAAIIVLSAGLIGAARWIGQSTAAEPFPLPDAEGCWQDVCVFDLPYSDMVAALDTHTDVTPGTARLVDDVYPTGNRFRLRFEYAPGPVGTLLYLNRNRYTIQHTPPGTPLLSLGALLTALGPPDSVNILPPYHVVLIYAERGLRVTVRPALRGEHGQTHLQPADPVTALDVYDPHVPPPQDALYYPRYFPWSGLGTYGVE